MYGKQDSDGTQIKPNSYNHKNKILRNTSLPLAIQEHYSILKLLLFTGISLIMLNCFGMYTYVKHKLLMNSLVI